MRASLGRSPSSFRSFLREAGTRSLPFCTRLGLVATGFLAMEGSWGKRKEAGAMLSTAPWPSPPVPPRSTPLHLPAQQHRLRPWLHPGTPAFRVSVELAWTLR